MVSNISSPKDLYKLISRRDGINFSSCGDIITIKNYAYDNNTGILYIEDNNGMVYSGNSNVVIDDFNRMLTFFEDDLTGIKVVVKKYESKRGKEYLSLELI